MNKNRIRGASVGRAGDLSRSPYPSRARSVDPAVVHRRRLSLPREICPVSPKRPRRLPVVLSPAEVGRLLASSTNIKHTALLSLAYAARLRTSEGDSLKLTHTDRIP